MKNFFFTHPLENKKKVVIYRLEYYFHTSIVRTLLVHNYRISHKLNGKNEN